MKKFFIIFIIFVSLFFGIIYFGTTQYFFNKFLAPNIKEYNFDYKSVNGSLLTGFEIEHLSYKGEELSSNVEFKFEPFNLFSGLISIDRLRLEGVNKESLSKVIKDFRPKDSNSSEPSRNINLNFEFRNILITIKPFKFKNLTIHENRLEIDYISYIYGKFNIGNSRYLYKTNLGNIDFSGKFKDKVLYIKNINLQKLNVKELLTFVDLLKKDTKIEKEETNSSVKKDNSVIGFMPKDIYLDNMNITLKPFKMKGVLAKDIKVSGSKIVFDVNNLILKNANLNIKYKSNLANIKSRISFNKNNLDIPNIDIDILKPSKIEKLITHGNKNSKSNSSSSSIKLISIVPLKRVKIDKLKFRLNNFRFKNEIVEKVQLDAKKFSFNINKSILKLNNLTLKGNTSLADIYIKGSIKDKINIETLKLSTNNANKIKKLVASLDSNSSSSKSSINLPRKLFIKDAKIDLKELDFLPYIVKNGEIEAKNTDINLAKFNIKSGELSVTSISNWGDTELKGPIKNSNFYASGTCKVNQTLLDKYNVPLRANNLKVLNIVESRFGLDSLELTTTLSGNNILKSVDNFDIIDSSNIVKYDYKSGNTIWQIDGLIKTPYTSKAKLSNTLNYINSKLTYKGEIEPLKDLDFTKDLTSILGGLRAKYSGDSSNIDLAFSTKKLIGKLRAKGFKGGVLEIKNKESIKLNSITNLGKNFKKSVITKVDIKAPINFKKLMPIKGDFALKSNLVDLKGSFKYDKYFSTKLKAFNPKKSITLKNINIKPLFPLSVDLTAKQRVDINLKNKMFKSDIKYNTKTKDIALNLKSATLKLKANGTTNNVKLNLSSSNIYKSLKEVNRVYKFKEIPKVYGAIKIDSTIKNFKSVRLVAKSKKIEYKDKKKSTKIENILLDLKYNKNSLVLNRYKVKASGYSIFANKASSITIRKDNLIFNKFWINDLALLKGNYSLKTLRGKFSLNSSNFKIKSDDGDASLKLNTKIEINKDKYAISGLVDILRAKIKKNLTTKSVADNEDIIILQRQRAKKSTKYAKNIKLNLKVVSKGGIVYAQNGTYFKMYPKVKILKRFNALTKITGTIKLDKSSYYKFRDKKLRLRRGLITFKGKSSTPYLNIVMYYRGKDYTININVSGTPARPVLYFSSNPPLSKDQILAYLLFDDSSAAGTHSQQAMLNLIGGTLAKSFFGAIGIKIDHISIKENGFSIGKSINDKVTIYYNQSGDKPSIKTRIDITKSVHTDIEVGEDSQSADIIFSKEY